MVITYHGGECFKVSFGDTTLAFNPISKSSSLTAVKFGADVALVSLNHPDFNGTEQVAYGDRTPFVISGPGEYEVGAVAVRGFQTVTTYDGTERINTIYQVSLEDMNIIFLGAMGDAKIDASILSEFGDIDILFVPIGGPSGESVILDASEASALSVKLEARAIIPMHYDDKALTTFLKEQGVDAKAQEKFTVKKKDIAIMEGEIVVLKM